MGGLVELWWLPGAILRELTLFAAIGFLIGGIDELVVDLIWIGWTIRRKVVVPARLRADVTSLAPADRPGRIAIIIPAWDESAVIGGMLNMTLHRFGAGDYRLYVGCYPNDPSTIAEVEARAARDDRVRPVVCSRPGPTTKADCLNHLWAAVVADGGAKAVVLHDAEDVVHSAEIGLFDRLIERFQLVQLPVLPLLDDTSRWVAGSYIDAFAEAHGKSLVVREAIGAAVPSAGVGCAIDYALLAQIAEARGGSPFDADSLTEDYELGLIVHQLGGRGVFVRLPGIGMRGVVAVREHFPAEMDAAVRQKARWVAGIALHGWDRMGWSGGLAETWMRLRDRRAPLAAIVLAAGYAALLGWGLVILAGGAGPSFGVVFTLILHANVALLLWRAVMRFGFVAHAYGWREGLRAIPRMLVGNVIDLAAARRAIMIYLRAKAGGAVRWDKTTHRFPAFVPPE